MIEDTLFDKAMKVFIAVFFLVLIAALVLVIYWTVDAIAHGKYVGPECTVTVRGEVYPCSAVSSPVYHYGGGA